MKHREPSSYLDKVKISAVSKSRQVNFENNNFAQSIGPKNVKTLEYNVCNDNHKRSSLEEQGPPKRIHREQLDPVTCVANKLTTSANIIHPSLNKSSIKVTRSSFNQVTQPSSSWAMPVINNTMKPSRINKLSDPSGHSNVILQIIEPVEVRAHEEHLTPNPTNANQTSSTPTKIEQMSQFRAQQEVVSTEELTNSNEVEE